RGIGAIRGAIAAIIRPSTAPIAEVREATADDLVAVARIHASEAARRTATAGDIAETGEGKRRLAKGASIGVNAIGVGVMLATFIHTAGLTGTEVGIA